MSDLTTDLASQLRPAAAGLPESGIIHVMNHGWEKPEIIPLWAGEGDLPTPQFICDAANKSMLAGETFYTYQSGLPELRSALADYHSRLYNQSFKSDRFFITGSGMQAIQLAVQAIAGDGDEIVVPTPAWPNISAAVDVIGATPVQVPMAMRANKGWSLDLDQSFDKIGPRTKAIFINSPGNPTGWTATKEELTAILEVARAKGLWVIADEVYGRFCYTQPLAPSFLDVAERDDRILYVNTFSKNWAMTGWRVGWLQAPAELGQEIENLIQYSTSGVAAFMQRAAIVAVNEGEPFVAKQIARARAGRKIVCEALAPLDRVKFAWPDGAFYLLLAIDGYDESMPLALKLVDEANIGLAPGSAFGLGGEPYLRLCFGRSPDSLIEVMNRLTAWLAKN